MSAKLALRACGDSKSFGALDVNGLPLKHPGEQASPHTLEYTGVRIPSDKRDPGKGTSDLMGALWGLFYVMFGVSSKINLGLI